MKIVKKTLLLDLENNLAPDTAPVMIRDILSQTIQRRYFLDPVEASEKAEIFADEVRRLIREKHFESENDYFGYFYHLRISDINEDYIHGACFVFPGDEDHERKAKSHRSKHVLISQYIDRLSPNEFETFCGKLIGLIGVREPIVTPQGGDQGVDFFGRWDLQSAIKQSTFPGGVERQFRAWIVGQAKKYDSTKVTTNIVRELVGSVQLAKAKVFSSEIDHYTKLGVAFCDPVFYCLIVTGAITSGVAKLLREAGIIFFDKDLISVFLSDLAPGKFDADDESSFRVWALGS